MTRSAGLNRLKAGFKSKIRENSFAFPSIQVWNSALPEVTTAETEAKSRAAIKKYVCEDPASLVDKGHHHVESSGMIMTIPKGKDIRGDQNYESKTKMIIVQTPISTRHFLIDSSFHHLVTYTPYPIVNLSNRKSMFLCLMINVKYIHT